MTSTDPLRWASQEASIASGLAEAEVGDLQCAAKASLDWLSGYVTEIGETTLASQVTSLLKTPARLANIKSPRKLTRPVDKENWNGRYPVRDLLFNETTNIPHDTSSSTLNDLDVSRENTIASLREDNQPVPRALPSSPTPKVSSPIKELQAGTVLESLPENTVQANEPRDASSKKVSLANESIISQNVRDTRIDSHPVDQDDMAKRSLTASTDEGHKPIHNDIKDLPNDAAYPQLSFAPLPPRAPLTTKKSLAPKPPSASGSIARHPMVQKSDDHEENYQNSTHDASSPLLHASAVLRKRNADLPSPPRPAEGSVPSAKTLSKPLDNEDDDWIPLSGRTTASPRKLNFPASSMLISSNDATKNQQVHPLHDPLSPAKSMHEKKSSESVRCSPQKSPIRGNSPAKRPIFNQNNSNGSSRIYLKRKQQFSSPQKKKVELDEQAGGQSSPRAMIGSPIGSAFRSITSSTADAFRKARNLFSGGDLSYPHAEMSSLSSANKIAPPAQPVAPEAKLSDDTALPTRANPERDIVLGEDLTTSNEKLYPNISHQGNGSPSQMVTIKASSTAEHSGLSPVAASLDSKDKNAMEHEFALQTSQGSKSASLSSTDTPTSNRSLGDPAKQPKRNVKPLSEEANAAIIRALPELPPMTNRKRVAKPTLKESQSPKHHKPPLTIKVSTAAQRELDTQRKAQINNGVKAADVADRPQQPHIVGSTARPTLPHTKSGTLSTPLIKSLAAAENAKRREEEERQRKLEAKRDIERRRRENQLQTHESQTEEPVQQQQLQTKKAVAPSGKGLRPLKLLETKDHDLGRQQIKEPPPKRLSTQKTMGASQDHMAKRRRTNDAAVASPTAAKNRLVIPQSQIRKDNINKSSGSSLLKSVVKLRAVQAMTQNTNNNNNNNSHLVGEMSSMQDVVKFSNDKLNFATISKTSSRNNEIGSDMETSMKNDSECVIRFSHQSSRLTTKSTESKEPEVVLPDIMSDSEDETESNVLMDWADSPELKRLLHQQQRIDPDTVFGPIAPLHMEEIFRHGTSRLSKFRARSSSANWSNQDRLTPAEVESYAVTMGYKGSNSKESQGQSSYLKPSSR